MIFETSECTESFYYFEDGAPFGGSEECISSRVVTERIRTPSGPGLGLTPAEVTRILGTPSVKKSDFLAYRYEAEMERTKEQLQAAKREDPSPLDLKYQNSLYLVVRFRNGRWWYLDAGSGMCRE